MFGLDIPTTKTSSSILCFTKDEVTQFEPLACINCGRCVEACPEQLIPSRLAKFATNGLMSEFEKWHGLECIECGSCTFACPSRRQVAQPIKTMKKLTLAEKEKQLVKNKEKRWIKVSELFHVSSSPHVRSKDSTSRIMLYVIIALLPTSFFGIYNFGIRALLLIVITIASCVASEWVFNKIVKKKNTVDDLSAVVTGLLLALNLPAGLPWWEAVLGGVFAIIIVKCMFGGLGQNFMNPALGARCFLLIAFAADMTNFNVTSNGVDVYSGATPLALIKNEGLDSVNVKDMLIGNTAGTIGETSVIAIMIGAIILIMLGVIDLKIPASYIITFAVFMFLFGADRFNMNYVVAELCGGGLMLGAFFMATDYVTSPITPKGQIIFGICCGLLTGIFRCFGANAEGVSFSIILSNVLVPIIEKISVPRAFGLVKEAKKNE